MGVVYENAGAESLKKEKIFFFFFFSFCGALQKL
jgi:hypothetical protein